MAKILDKSIQYHLKLNIQREILCQLLVVSLIAFLFLVLLKSYTNTNGTL